MLIRNGIERFNNRYPNFFDSAASVGFAALLGACFWAANQTETGEHAIDDVESKLDRAGVVLIDGTNAVLGGIVGVKPFEPIGPDFSKDGIVDRSTFYRDQYQRLDPDQVIG